MPGNEVEDGFRYLYELENISRGQLLPQAVDNLRGQVIDTRIAQSVVSSDINLEKYNAQKLGSLRGDGAESSYFINAYVNGQFNVDAFPLANQLQPMQNQPELFYESSGYNKQNIFGPGGSSFLQFQIDNDSVGSPTLTTNSERSEITEASTDFFFPKKPQETFSSLKHCSPKYRKMQQSGYDEMQMLQQQEMLKQLQDLQRQQQLQQHNYLSPSSTFHKQASSSQFSPRLDWLPLNDASQGYVTSPARVASSAQQEFLRGAMLSVGFNPQQLDRSLYPTPVGNMGRNTSQQTPIQIQYQDSKNLSAKPDGRTQKSALQLSDISNLFTEDRYNLSQDQISISSGAFMSKQGKRSLGTGHCQVLNSVFVSDNLLTGVTEQTIIPSKNLVEMQKQVCWFDMQKNDAQPSQSLVPLDPLEEKILFSVEDNSIYDIASGVFGNTFDNTDVSNASHSILSGSWSALMHSAVAEASSSNIIVKQDEWSGSALQNAGSSVDNNMVYNFIDRDRQQTGWVNNSFPGSTFPSLEQQKDGLYQGATRRAPKVTGLWVDHTREQKSPMGDFQQVQSCMHMNDTHATKLDSLSDALQPMTSSNNTSQIANWNTLSGLPGNSWTSSRLDVKANSLAPFGHDQQIPNKDDQQIKLMLNSPVASKSAAESLPDVHLFSSTTKPVNSPNHTYNQWTEVPIQNRLPNEAPIHCPLVSFSSMDVTCNVGIKLPMVQQTTSEVCDAPQRVDLPLGQATSANHISKAISPLSNSLHACFRQQETDIPGLAASKQNIPSASHSLEVAHHVPKNNSLVHQLQTRNCTETNPSKRDQMNPSIPYIQQIAGMMAQRSYGNTNHEAAMDSELNLRSERNPLSLSNSKLPSSMIKAKRFQTARASSGIVGLGQCHSQGQLTNNNMVSSDIEPNQVNLHAPGPNWLKQLGTFRNGQMLPLKGSRNGADGQFPTWNLSHNLHRQGIVEQEDQGAQNANVRPLETANQNSATVGQMKRKHSILEQLAWCREVTQGSRKHQRVSVAEKEWAQATNRLFEMVMDEVGMIQLPVSRSKKKLLLTSQLVQQLISPAPTFILSGDVTVNYNVVLYVVARATLGDACSFTYCGESHRTDTKSEKLKTFHKALREKYSAVAKGFIEKAKKLQDDFQRLERSASITDIKLDIENFESFSVINCFAKFHSQAQAGTSQKSLPSAVPKQISQRYVTAVPMPRSLPEGVQCLSL